MEWLQNLPVVWMALVIFAATYSVTAAIYTVVMALAVGERARAFKAVSPGMLPPLGIIFGLLVGFIAAQIWGDFDRAQTAVTHEASALRAVVLLATSFPGEFEAGMHSLVRRHIQEVATQEWPMMAHTRATLTIIPRPLAEALKLTLALTPSSDGQVVAQSEMAHALENALDARRQRIVISRSSVNGVKWACLLLQAAGTLIAIAMVHSDNRTTAAIALAIFATGVALSVLLIAAHRPFSGDFSVRPDLLLQVMPEDLAQASGP
jgi:hypothetical protein